MGLPILSLTSRTTPPEHQSASPSPHIMNNSRSPSEAAVSDGAIDRLSKAATGTLGKGATVPSEDDLQTSETDRSLQALNALLAASYTQGYIARTASPSHTAVPIDVRYTSVLPPAIAEYAASYPLIAIASIGALGTAVLLGTGALTARILRRAMPARTSTELGNMERRLKVELFDLKGGVGRESAYTSHALKAIALKLDEGRLGMVVKQALEQVAAAKSSSAGSGMGEGLLNDNRDLNQVMASVQRLETVTLGILEEIRLLRESQGAAPALSSTLTSEPQGVLSMSELSDMIERFQAQTRELNEGIPSAGDEVESEKASTGGSSLDVNDEHAVNRAIYGYDIRARDEAAAIVVDELGKAGKVKKTRKTKGREMVVEEDAAISSQSTSAASPVGSGLETDSTIQPEAPLHESSPPGPANSVSASEQVPLLDRAETSAGTASEADPTVPAKRRYRKRTPLPASAVDEMADGSTQSGPLGDLTGFQPHSTRLGVVNDGSWAFQVMTSHHVVPERGWHKTELLVTRHFSVARGVRTWGPNKLPIRIDSIERSAELVRAPVFHNPNVELVILDGGAWQCHSLGRDGEYTIGVRLGDA